MTNRAQYALGELELGTAAGGDLRWAFADLTAIVEAARGRLDLSPLASAAVGRLMIGSVLLLRMFSKSPSRLMVEVRGSGPLERVVADADEDGSVRGMASHAQVSLPTTAAGKLDVGGAIGEGTLHVTRAREGRTYSSQVELASGEIGDDLAHFLHQSEQRRSAVSVGVLTRRDGIAAAGGMIIEALPGASEESLGQLERNLAGISQHTGGISRMLEHEGRESVIATFLAGLESDSQEQRELAYRCRCSRERLRHQLSTLSAEDQESLYDDGKIVAECTFCGESYSFATLD